MPLKRHGGGAHGYGATMGHASKATQGNLADEHDKHAARLIKAELRGGRSYPSLLTADTYLSGDGDSLRVVAQAKQFDFGYNQRPGVYVVSALTGVNGAVPLQLPFGAGIRGAGLLAFFYDPFTRTFANRCAPLTFHFLPTCGACRLRDMSSRLIHSSFPCVGPRLSSQGAG